VLVLQKAHWPEQGQQQQQQVQAQAYAPQHILT
jgi:hypothetical protein